MRGSFLLKRPTDSDLPFRSIPSPSSAFWGTIVCSDLLCDNDEKQAVVTHTSPPSLLPCLSPSPAPGDGGPEFRLTGHEEDRDEQERDGTANL
jgi:hypothetical protein